MPYEVKANRDHPALLILLFDMSGSMEEIMERETQKRRIDVVWLAFASLRKRLFGLTTKGQHVAARYRIALFSYSDDVVDMQGGIKPVADILSSVPFIVPRGGTNTAKAFASAKALLERELREMQNCPAPLVLHMTDGEYNGDDPEPIARQIMAMSVPDGPVLVENIFISESILPTPITDPRTWPGILPDTILTNPYAEKLRAMSSPLPESYREVMADEGYRLMPGALMLLPGTNRELVRLGFQIAEATAAGGGRGGMNRSNTGTELR